VEEGRQVRAVVHRVDNRSRSVIPSPAEIVAGDALNAASVQQLSKDASTIYHTVNVPYQKWDEVMPVVTDNILSAAKEVGAKVVFPGNVYGYGRFGGKPATEEHPPSAITKKGKLRIELENRLMEAHRAGRTKVVIPRFPDFYGPNVTNRLFGGIFIAAISGKKGNWIGKLDVPHDLVYIDDAARACVLLGSKEQTYGQVWHVPGAGPITGRKFIENAFQAAGKKPDIGVLGGGLVRIAGIVSADARQVTELLYEFEEPLLLDGSKFSREFPDFKFTSYEEGIRLTVEWFQKWHAPSQN
jgi:nucleoside-diphosphate-sugar epimerase